MIRKLFFMMPDLKIVFLILIFSAIAPVISQARITENADHVHIQTVRTQSWVKEFTGAFDDLHAINMTIRNQDNILSGEYKYVESGETFKIDGFIRGTKLLLEEISDTHGTTGYFRGVLDDMGYQGTWTDQAESRSMSFRLREKKNKEEEWDCRENKWTRMLSGKVQNENISVLLSRDTDDQLSGWIVFSENNKYYRLIGDCISKHCGGAELIFMDNNEVKGNIRIYENEDRIYEASISMPDYKEQGIVLIKTNEYKMDCLAWSDFGMIADAVFLHSGEKKFDSFLHNQVSNKFQSSRNEYLQMKSNLGEFNRDDRLRWSFHSWNDIHYLSDRLISGILTFVASGNTEAQRIAYIFDLSKGKLIDPAELIKEKQVIQQKALEIFRSRQEGASHNKSIGNWLLRDTLDLVTLKPHGLSFSTGFHPVIGESNVVIPFEDLEDQLKRTNLTKELTKP